MLDGDTLDLKLKMWLIISDSYVLHCIYFFFLLQLPKNDYHAITVFFWGEILLPLPLPPPPAFKLIYWEMFKMYLTVYKHTWLWRTLEAMMLNCSTPILSLVSHTCMQRPQQMMLSLFPSWTAHLAPSQWLHMFICDSVLNFQGEPTHPTFLSMAYALAEESCQRKMEHLSSSPART